MSSPSFSPQFAKRWLATPVAAKQAFHQELSDIIAMLKSDEPSEMFAFTYDDFGEAVSGFLHVYDDKHKPEPAPELPKTAITLDPQELDGLEATIYKKLATQLDDFLSEEMLKLSEELKNWLRHAIKEELANHQKS